MTMWHNNSVVGVCARSANPKARKGRALFFFFVTETINF